MHGSVDSTLSYLVGGSSNKTSSVQLKWSIYIFLSFLEFFLLLSEALHVPPIYRKRRDLLVLMSEVDLSRQVDLCFKSLSSSSAALV